MEKQAYCPICDKNIFVVTDDNIYHCPYCNHRLNLRPLEDGLHIELFAVKDGVRYNAKIVNMRDVTAILTNSLMDGVEKLWK